MWLALCESVIPLATTAIADRVGTEVENSETSCVANRSSTPEVLRTGYDTDTYTYPEQRDQQEDMTRIFAHTLSRVTNRR